MTSKKLFWLTVGVSLIAGTLIGVISTVAFIKKTSHNISQAAWISGHEALLKSQFADAISFFARSVALFPENYEAHTGLGQAYEGLGILKLARNEYEHAAKLIDGKELPDYTEKAILLTKVGEIDLREGQYIQAVSSYERAIAISPQWPDAYYGLGLSYYKQGHTKQAKESLKKFLQYESRENRATEKRNAAELVKRLETE